MGKIFSHFVEVLSFPLILALPRNFPKSFLHLGIKQWYEFKLPLQVAVAVGVSSFEFVDKGAGRGGIQVSIT
jgi:hypothetical protein